jgi:hypothetical protein
LHWPTRNSTRLLVTGKPSRRWRGESVRGRLFPKYVNASATSRPCPTSNAATPSSTRLCQHAGSQSSYRDQRCSSLPPTAHAATQA